MEPADGQPACAMGQPACVTGQFVGAMGQSGGVTGQSRGAMGQSGGAAGLKRRSACARMEREKPGRSNIHPVDRSMLLLYRTNTMNLEQVTSPDRGARG